MEFDNLVPYPEVVKIIDRVLLVHCGSVDKFKLHIINPTSNDMDRWILYLSRNGIKELSINNMRGEFYNFPSSIYSCSDLEHLVLIKCIFNPPPAAFKAFSNLKVLLFALVEISSTMLEIIVNSCPLLCVLMLAYIDHCPSLKINAPNLLVLDIRDVYCYFQFKNTPRLEYAWFSLGSPVSSHNANGKDCKIVELLGSMPLLQGLKFHEFALQHLAVGIVPTRLPSICSIKLLNISINFEDLQELLAAFCIFRSSPSIKYLQLTVFGDKNTARIPANGFWGGKHDLSFKFEHLRNIQVTSFTGNENELKLIEFVLGNAPVLKTMEVKFSDDKNVKDLFCVAKKKIVQFHRISPDVELILPKHEYQEE